MTVRCGDKILLSVAFISRLYRRLVGEAWTTQTPSLRILASVSIIVIIIDRLVGLVVSMSDY